MKYRVDVEAEDVNGCQTWEIEADSPEEALANIWDGEIVEEDLEVQRSAEPTLEDVYPWSNPPKSKNIDDSKNSPASPVQQLKDSISNLATMRDSTKVSMSKTEVAGMKVAFNAVIAKLSAI